MTRNNLAKIFYAAMLVVALAVFVFANTAPGMGEVSVILHGAVVVLGLCVVAALALISLITGWHNKVIRYSILGIAGVIAGAVAFNFATEFYHQQRSEERHAQYNSDKDVINGIINAYRPRYLASRSEPQAVLSLFSEIDQKLEREGIYPYCRVSQHCQRQFDYIRFIGSAFLYLGIFVDEKYIDSISNLSAASFYTDFYEDNASAFTGEVHFSRLFNAIFEKSDHPDWLHGKTLNLLSRTLADRGYIETYLRLIPITPSEFSDSYRVPEQVLKGALTLAEKTGDDRAIIAALDHFAYNYPSTGSPCELKKFDAAFDVLKESKNLDAYIDLLFSQMPAQCSDTTWRAGFEVNEEVYCYLQKKLDWVRRYTSDGKIKEKLLSEIDCTAER